MGCNGSRSQPEIAIAEDFDDEDEEPRSKRSPTSEAKNLLVTFAGTSEVNGRYHEDGFHRGGRRFKQGNGPYYIRLCGSAAFEKKGYGISLHRGHNISTAIAYFAEGTNLRSKDLPAKGVRWLGAAAGCGITGVKPSPAVVQVASGPPDARTSSKDAAETEKEKDKKKHPRLSSRDCVDTDAYMVALPRSWSEVRREMLLPRGLECQGYAMPLKYALRGTSRRVQVDRVINESCQALLDNTWKEKITRDRRSGHCMGKLDVVHVLRNENPRLWAHYYLRKQEIAELRSRGSYELYQAKTGEEPAVLQRLLTNEDRVGEAEGGQDVLDAKINEFYLFHGTRPSAANAICDAEFDVKLAGEHRGMLYGQGAYFAESSSKADEYAHDDEDGLYRGLYAMLLTRVVCGRILYSDAKNPKADHLMEQVCQERAFDSVLGDREKIRDTYREFVVFDAKQTYPEYIIIYKRKA